MRCCEQERQRQNKLLLKGRKRSALHSPLGHWVRALPTRVKTLMPVFAAGIRAQYYQRVKRQSKALTAAAGALLLFLTACTHLPTDRAARDGAMVSETPTAIVMQGSPGSTHTAGFMFYPGAQIDPHAYIPWLSKLAAAGIPVVVAKMPANLAVFSPDAGLALTSQVPGTTRWVIGGHSLGGAMAAWSVYAHPSAYVGVVFLAAYPSASRSLASWPRPVLSISASNDGLATPKKIADTVPLLPLPLHTVTGLGQYAPSAGGYSVLYQIQGGNHAQFGSYGLQDGDGSAGISAAAQHAEVLGFIEEFFARNGW